MGAITVGVQGEDAAKIHTADLGVIAPGAGRITVGDLAKVHELGLGVPRRSWLVDWMDENKSTMSRETRTAMKAVLSGKRTRKDALAKLGYDWTKAVRDRMAAGGVKPPISAETAERKGHNTPLVETFDLHNHVTYRVFLPKKKSIKNAKQRRAVGG